MKLCVVQISSLCGDVAQNIEKHELFVNMAADHAADMVIFPELSLTGYEPTLADRLAMSVTDTRLDELQVLSDAHKLVIGAGAPTRGDDGLHISMILFRPNQPQHCYSKQYLHADEEPFFVAGNSSPIINLHDLAVAPAICYEVFVPAHAQAAHAAGGQVYVASVAKAAGGMERAMLRMPEIARATDMPVLLSNSVGPSDDFIGAGRSAIWEVGGALLAQLDAEAEGLLIYDTETGQTVEMIA